MLNIFTSPLLPLSTKNELQKSSKRPEQEENNNEFIRNTKRHSFPFDFISNAIFLSRKHIFSLVFLVVVNSSYSIFSIQLNSFSIPSILFDFNFSCFFSFPLLFWLFCKWRNSTSIDCHLQIALERQKVNKKKKNGAAM